MLEFKYLGYVLLEKGIQIDFDKIVFLKMLLILKDIKLL